MILRLRANLGTALSSYLASSRKVLKMTFTNSSGHLTKPINVVNSKGERFMMGGKSIVMTKQIRSQQAFDWRIYKKPSYQHCYFATNEKEKPSSNDDDSSKEKPEKERTLHDTINRLQGKEDENNVDGDKSREKSFSNASNVTSTIHSLSSAFQSFSGVVGDTWTELLESSQPTDINKKLAQYQKSQPGSASDDDDDAADKYKGSTAVMVINEEDNFNAFERIQKRLSEAPIIQGVFQFCDWFLNFDNTDYMLDGHVMFSFIFIVTYPLTLI